MKKIKKKKFKEHCVFLFICQFVDGLLLLPFAGYIDCEKNLDVSEAVKIVVLYMLFRS